jgi:triosephosphate isomerase
MSRKPVIAANWKMFKTQAEAVDSARELMNLVWGYEDVEIVVCPPYTAIGAVLEVVKGSNVGLGAQGLHWEDQGAYTSQVSLPMLEDAGCQYVVIGHSECREYLGETDEMVNLKVKKVLTSELTPIVCVGESLDSREAGKAKDFVRSQLEGGLKDLTAAEASRIIIAYEPIWAIGTGRTATPEIAQEVHAMIREWLKETFAEVGEQIRIQYGGSVKPANVNELMVQEDIDGALVGGASLEAESFAKIVMFR